MTSLYQDNMRVDDYIGNENTEKPREKYRQQYINRHREGNGYNQVTRFDKVWLTVYNAHDPYAYSRLDPYPSIILDARVYMAVESIILRANANYIQGTAVCYDVTIKPASYGRPIRYYIFFNNRWNLVGEITCFFDQHHYIKNKEVEFTSPEWKNTLLEPEDRRPGHTMERMLHFPYPFNSPDDPEYIKVGYQTLRCSWRDFSRFALGNHDVKIPFLYPDLKECVKFENVAYIGFDVSYSMYKPNL